MKVHSSYVKKMPKRDLTLKRWAPEIMIRQTKDGSHLIVVAKMQKMTSKDLEFICKK